MGGARKALAGAALLAGVAVVVFFATRSRGPEWETPERAATPLVEPIESAGDLLGGRVLPNLEVAGPPSFRTNDRGYRGPAVAVPKPAGTVRIAIAGGPFAFGRFAGAEGETLAGRLQSLLTRNLPDRTIEVVGVGTGAEPAWVGAALLDRDLAFDIAPDLLVWILEPSGPYPGWTRLARRRGETAPDDARRCWSPMVGSSETEALALAEAPASRALFTIGTEPWSSARDALARRLAADDAIRLGNDATGETFGSALAARLAFSASTETLAAVARRCAERGVRFAVAVLPHPLEIDPELRALLLDAVERERHTVLHAKTDLTAGSKMTDRLRGGSFPVLDFAASLRDVISQRRALLYALETGEWNAAAAEIVASGISIHAISQGIR